MRVFTYNRKAVLEYAEKWALKRNPAYYNFDKIGGDCTNFVSQCILAGAPVMNYTPTLGWYYNSVNDRTPSWTGVEYIYNFLINNKGVGPFASEIEVSQLQIGDLIQFGRNDGDFFHTPIVTGFNDNGALVSAHTYDAFNKPLTSFVFSTIRCIHIIGYRNY